MDVYGPGLHLHIPVWENTLLCTSRIPLEIQCEGFRRHNSPGNNQSCHRSPDVFEKNFDRACKHADGTDSRAHWLRKAKSLPHSYTDACPSSTALHLAPIRQKTDENVNLDSRKSTYSFLLNLLEGKDKVLNHYLSRPETTKVASALSAVPSLPESSLGCHNETV